MRLILRAVLLFLAAGAGCRGGPESSDYVRRWNEGEEAPRPLTIEKRLEEAGTRPPSITTGSPTASAGRRPREASTRGCASSPIRRPGDRAIDRTAGPHPAKTGHSPKSSWSGKAVQRSGRAAACASHEINPARGSPEVRAGR